jgi:hypothetical protein
MSARHSRARRAALAAAIAAVVAIPLASLRAARAGAGTSVGGAVESTLALSLGEPGSLVRMRAKHGRSAYEATIVAEVTATDAPTRLSLADGEAIAGARRGRMVRGASALSIPLRAGAGHGRYRSLRARVDPVLEQWGEPVSLGAVTIRLRQTVLSVNPAALDGYEKLLLVTVTAAGP